ncbi:TetR/AcrR family transcriptional regulator [Rhodospirillum rubrum]|uniref:Transcriptional regulator, TetR family n=1 Tax=Rhodospirillum rubrum (strain ATCC 11170 / ATH 1.1.1 / DSM 467 / LMG 4362 / NCIMB 8255 / S1) TaxID=269796 RepID=Q2RPT3_RHORT|nr:TetR/AcrR family transcriptional regulator [Rhodospirillum rubrum]ABC23862.1 transcriptional regulator, TetR family [Rhodospirillum rubrum ATCC 11170]MBK5955539.1 TetR family transcriptional regulator [Rhodospirillum rubrum]QXG79809.1 TetR/AcrR family transcriptional regulator [Rhodospirillum rubrum]HAP99353.1 TetR/AcrR family transcriptional regulator [Rhodospirillum rubrum]HCF17630.1 TetR/AcrR family transcriptional regulator [Rhodospirillum rubrum]
MSPSSDTTPRLRLSRADRTRQLLDVAWRLIGEEGTDALTLGRLAEAAGVSKPVVYDHFGTRNGLLAALYQDYDKRQTDLFDSALATSRPTAQDKAEVIASSYVDCVLTQGREIQAVLATLSGSPELAAIKRDYQKAFIDKCAATLAPFGGAQGLSAAGLWAMLGAAESLSEAAARGDLTKQQAQSELKRLILAMVDPGR